MPALSPSVTNEFCKLCGWAFETWLNHRALFDCNQRSAELQKSLASDTLFRLSVISQEYSLLQIAKLHDKAIIGGNITLSIEYVVNYGGWSPTTKTHLESLQRKLELFAAGIRGARNKSLSHNDLSSIVSGATLGSFAEGEDVEYFKNLQEFVDLVHDEVIGGPWPFDDLVNNDVAAFLTMLKT